MTPAAATLGARLQHRYSRTGTPDSRAVSLFPHTHDLSLELAGLVWTSEQNIVIVYADRVGIGLMYITGILAPPLRNTPQKS